MQNQTSLDAQGASSQHAVLSGRKAEGFRCTMEDARHIITIERIFGYPLLQRCRKPAKVIPPAAFGRRYDFSIRVYEVRSLCAEVGVLHDIVSAQILCCIAQHDLAGFEYIAAIRYLERLIGVLLDDKYSNTVLV